MSNHNMPTDQVNNPTKDNRDFIYIIPQSVLLDLDLHLVDLRVYAIVRSFMETTGEAYFSNVWAAKKLGVDPLTVSRSISKHIRKGHLNRDEDEAGRRYLSINLRARETLVSQRGVDLQIKGGVDLQINQLDQRSIITKMIKKPPTPLNKGDDFSKTDIESFTKKPTLQNVVSAKADLSIKQNNLNKEDIQAIFDKLWDGYPLKKAKQKALEALSKIFKGKPRDEAENLAMTIWEGLAACVDEFNAKTQLKEQGGDVWVPSLPHLTTWLNQRRWEDQYQTPQELLQGTKSKRGGINLGAIEAQWR